MFEYFRIDGPSTPVRWLLQIATAFTLLLFSLCASAQNGAAGSNSSQAVLQIRVNVVSTVMAPPLPSEPKLSLKTTVAYDIPGAKSNVEMIEETRTFVAPGSDQPQGAVLKTVTIVAR
jgi:hypothetical protein